jgi:hypothetical protein
MLRHGGGGIVGVTDPMPSKPIGLVQSQYRAQQFVQLNGCF